GAVYPELHAFGHAEYRSKNDGGSSLRWHGGTQAVLGTTRQCAELPHQRAQASLRFGPRRWGVHSAEQPHVIGQRSVWRIGSRMAAEPDRWMLRAREHYAGYAR